MEFLLVTPMERHIILPNVLPLFFHPTINGSPGSVVTPMEKEQMDSGAPDISPEEKDKMIASFAKALMGSMEDFIEQDTTEIKFPEPPAKNVMESRLQLAKIITARPHDFKICEGCDSIVREQAPICPSCLAYRFESDEARVCAQAVLLASQEPKETFI
jgi:hypothetical protein